MMFMRILKIIIQRRKKVLIAFDDMIADMENNKKLSPIVTELFLKGRKLMGKKFGFNKRSKNFLFLFLLA